MKWNSVFRIRDAEGLSSGEFTFRNFVIVGNCETVRLSLVELHRRFPRAAK